MLTRVVLEGAMGKQFGREWNLEVNSVGEALRLIDANKPGLFIWIKTKLDQFTHYRILCKFPDGRSEELDNDTFFAERQPSEIRVVPLLAGAGGVVKAVVGVVLIVAGVYFGQAWMVKLGATMLISSVVEMLSSKPKKTDRAQESAVASDGGPGSYYFDGPANTSQQGSPVSLIYGRVKVGSHPISASQSIDQLLNV